MAVESANVVQKREMNSTSFFDEFRKVAASGPERSHLPQAVDHPYVLVAEDDPRTAKVIKTILQSQGYEVAHAANGRLAIEMMQNRCPDLVVLDLMMPEMDGIAFLEEKGKYDDFQNVPVLIVSCSEEGGMLGAHAFVAKPFDRDILLETTWRLIQSKSEQPTVLVIDDDPKAIKLVSSHLGQQGYTLLTAHGGSEGLDIARKERPDLILLDLMMPDMSGFEVIELLREHEHTKDIPVVVLTSKHLSAKEHAFLLDKAAQIRDKSGFESQEFLGEVRRLMGDGVHA